MKKVPLILLFIFILSSCFWWEEEAKNYNKPVIDNDSIIDNNLPIENIPDNAIEDI